MLRTYDSNLSIPQSDFFMSTAPSVAAIAGFGSGKTFTLWMKIWRWLCEYPGIMHGYFAPTYGLIRDILYPLVSEWCGDRGIPYTILHSAGIIYIHGLGSVICRSMENPERIVGFEIGNAAVDEADILSTAKAWHAWRKIKARCRIKLFDRDGNAVRNQMALASTPEGYKMAYEAFYKSPLPDSQLIRMSTYSNAHNLPDNYIDDLKGNYPEKMFEAYILGKFTNLTSGTVYSSFSREFNLCHNVRLGNKEVLYVGMDFNVRKMAAIVHVKRPPFVVAYKELLDVADTPSMARLLIESFPGHPIVVYPDASGKHNDSRGASSSDLKILGEWGLRIRAKKRNPYVKNRINSMNAAFEGRRGFKYVVHEEGCPLYIETLEQQAFDKHGQPEKNKDQDHPNDAGGYFIDHDYGITKPSTKQVEMTGI